MFSLIIISFCNGRRKNLDIIRFYNQLEFDLIEWKKSYQYQQQHQESLINSNSNIDDNYLPEEEYVRLSNMVRKRKMNSLCYSTSKELPHNSQPNPIQYENKEEKRKRKGRMNNNNNNNIGENIDDNNNDSSSSSSSNLMIRSEGCRNMSYKPCSYSLCAMPVDYIDMLKYLFHSDYNLTRNSTEESKNTEKEEVTKSEVAEPLLSEESK